MTPAQLAQAFEPLDRGQACPEIGSVLPSKVSGGPLLTDLGNHSVRIQGVISGPQLMVAQPANGPNAGTTLLLSSAGDETVLNGDQRSAVEQQWSRRGGLSAGITVPEQGSSAYQLACSEID